MSKAHKLIWKVDPPPTGPYRSFSKRGWPTAEYSDQKMAFSIRCDAEYVPSNLKTGNHPELTVLVADYRGNGWAWRKLTQRCKTLAEAKELAQKFIDKYPEFAP